MVERTRKVDLLAEDATGDACTPGTEFLDRLAHDLRGPLSPLQTAAYLLRRDDLDPARQRDLLDIIERQTARLSGMVQEVSDWMRARQSRLVGHREPLPVPMLMDLVCARSPDAPQAEVDPALDEVMVDGDAQRLVQMLSTLLGYMRSRAPAPTLVAMRDGDRVRITVASATPWAAGEAEALLDEAEPAPFDEGLGMRLLIAQAITRDHGGGLQPGRAPAGGATLEVWLPLSSGPDVSPAPSRG